MHVEPNQTIVSAFWSTTQIGLIILITLRFAKKRVSKVQATMTTLATIPIWSTMISPQPN